MTNEQIMKNREECIAKRRMYAQAIRVLNSETFPNCPEKHDLTAAYQEAVETCDAYLRDLADAMVANNLQSEEKKYTESELQEAVKQAIEEHREAERREAYKKRQKFDYKDYDRIWQALDTLGWLR